MKSVLVRLGLKFHFLPSLRGVNQATEAWSYTLFVHDMVIYILAYAYFTIFSYLNIQYLTIQYLTN